MIASLVMQNTHQSCHLGSDMQAMMAGAPLLSLTTPTYVRLLTPRTQSVA